LGLGLGLGLSLGWIWKGSLGLCSGVGVWDVGYWFDWMDLLLFKNYWVYREKVYKSI
jgi:hypothetical protein